jgi:hypothetical protein
MPLLCVAVSERRPLRCEQWQGSETLWGTRWYRKIFLPIYKDRQALYPVPIWRCVAVERCQELRPIPTTKEVSPECQS